MILSLASVSVAVHAEVPATKEVPIGTILAFAGPTQNVPKNYLVCDGKKYDRLKYPKLFDAIGSSWGGDGVNKFNVPDLQGIFLRGVDSNPPKKDVDAANRKQINPGGHDGNAVGSFQPDEVIRHNHPANMPSSGEHGHPVNINKSGIAGTNSSRDVAGGTNKFNSDPTLGAISAVVPEGTGAHTHPINVNDIGGSETRPKNAAVYWIIRAE